MGAVTQLRHRVRDLEAENASLRRVVEKATYIEALERMLSRDQKEKQMETDQDAAVVTPLEVYVGVNAEVKFEVGAEARSALRRDAIRSLHEALTVIKDAEEQMPAFDDPTVRASLEYLTQGIKQADRAAGALWYLAPEYDDGEPVE